MVRTPQRRQSALSHALPLVRGLAIVLAMLELVDVILRPDPGPVPVTLALLAVAAVAVTPYRLGLGVALAAAPVLSVMVLPGVFVGVLPAVVTVISAFVRWPLARTAVLIMAYCLVGIGIGGLGLVPPTRMTGFFAWLAGGSVIGALTRLLVQRSTRAAREITRLEHSVAEVRGEERAQLADELSDLLVASLDTTHASLDRAVRSGDARVLADVLTQTEKATRTGLFRLRGLVSTLRSATEPDESPPASLITAIEEVEEVLVGHGHPAELDLCAVRPGMTGQAAVLIVAAVRAGAEHVRERGAAGAGVTISLAAVDDTATVRVAHDVTNADESTTAQLRALQEQFAQHGGTLHFDTSPTQWCLDATVPLAAARSGAAPPKGRPWATRISRRVTRVVVTIAGAVGVIRVGGDAIERFSVSNPGWMLDTAWAALWLALALCTWSPPTSGIVLVAALVGVAIMPIPDADLAWLVSVLGMGLIGLVAWRRPRWTPVGLLVFVLYLIATWRPAYNEVVSWSMFLATATIGALVGLTVHHFLAQREMQLGEMRRLRTERSEARLQERRQLAGELHDIVAHQLSLISMQVRAHQGSDDLDELMTTAHDVLRVNASAQADLTTLAHVMRDHHSGTSDPGGSDRTWLTPSRAAEAVATTLRNAGHEVELDVAADADDSDPTTQRTVSRILREATTNILRYAPVDSACEIAVTTSPQWLTVQVANPLPREPVSHPHSTGLGLVGLAERVALTGGAFEAAAHERQWVVAARLRRRTHALGRRRTERRARLSPARRPQTSGINDAELDRPHEHLRP